VTAARGGCGRPHHDMAALVARVRELRDGDVVLVKASRGCHLDEFVSALVNDLRASADREQATCCITTVSAARDIGQRLPLHHLPVRLRDGDRAAHQLPGAGVHSHAAADPDVQVIPRRARRPTMQRRARRGRTVDPGRGADSVAALVQPPITVQIALIATV
jgi:hypothetical protein